jgi:ABC-2 type transport system ATP-binding protein
MKMISRLILPSEGEVWIRQNGDLQLLTAKNKDALLDQIGFLIETPTFYDHMTPRQVLSYFAKLKGYPKKKIPDRIVEVLSWVKLSDWIDKKIGTFSKGMKQKLGIVSTIVHDPAVIVLDEPQSGLDPKARREVRQLLVKLKHQGKTIFLSSHLLYEVSEISDRIAIINYGKLIAFDTIDNLESITQDSVLKIELLKLPEDITQKRSQLESLIKPITGMNNGAGAVLFNPDSKVFEVKFDGSLDKQYKILKELTKAEIDVVDFSVPRTNSLEDLYVSLISGAKPPAQLEQGGEI